MTTVSDIIAFMETVAPQCKKERWDNVGLSCGRQDKQVRTILVALDPFEDVSAEAVQVGADLIVTHHPLLFHPGPSGHRRDCHWAHPYDPDPS